MEAEHLAPFHVESRKLSETASFPDTPLAMTRVLAISLARTAELAGALVRSGRQLDLHGLDLQVGLLCARALDLAPAEGQQLRGELIALRSALEALGGMLGLPPPGR